MNEEDFLVGGAGDGCGELEKEARPRAGPVTKESDGFNRRTGPGRPVTRWDQRRRTGAEETLTGGGALTESPQYSYFGDSFDFGNWILDAS